MLTPQYHSEGKKAVVKEAEGGGGSIFKLCDAEVQFEVTLYKEAFIKETEFLKK